MINIPYSETEKLSAEEAQHYEKRVNQRMSFTALKYKAGLITTMEYELRLFAVKMMTLGEIENNRKTNQK